MTAFDELRREARQLLRVVDLTGRPAVPYRDAWALQRDLVRRRAAEELGDTVLLLEHPRTYTLGSRADRGNLLFDDTELGARGIDVLDVDRGGDVTYHGPGQVVGYPVLRLAGPRVVDHVRMLEEVNLRVLHTFGLQPRRVPGYSGVWVDDTKLTAVGVRVSSGLVTQHGWATNVTTDLDDYAGIVACGITDPDKRVGSLRSLGVVTTVGEVARRTTLALGEVLACDVVVEHQLPRVGAG